MLKVTYDASKLEPPTKLSAVNALYRLRNNLSLKESKDIFDSGMLFVSGTEWDKLEGSFRFATVTLAKRDERKTVIHLQCVTARDAIYQLEDQLRHKQEELARLIALRDSISWEEPYGKPLQ
jgi:hypothetical protein